MVVRDLDVDPEGEGQGTVLRKNPGPLERKKEGGGEMLEFAIEKGSGDGAGIGKRTSVSVIKEAVEEAAGVDKLGWRWSEKI